ncbi:MAG: response regulator transcription factor [Thermoanaerobaculia bacterium]|nr:response regulator transcription factor [Thermoanaerobaculia bacterium]
MRILVVEDDATLAEALVEILQGENYAVDCAKSGSEADIQVAVNSYDLIVLDWSIPPPSGLELLQSWRNQGIATPVLMLTGRLDLEDRVSGLDSGADDYLTKPFAFAELLARVRSLLRRRDRPLPPLETDGLQFDRHERRVTIDGDPVHLTPKEFGILEYLLRNLDRPVSREELVEHVWDDSFSAMSNSVDVIVSRLRRKVDGDRPEKLLHTMTGVGYRLASKRSVPE